MFPFYGQGAAQAIEDAAALARCLAAATAGGAGRAGQAEGLRRYEAARIPRTTRLQEVSHARGHLNHLPDGAEQQARDQAFAATDALAANAWIYAYDPTRQPSPDGELQPGDPLVGAGDPTLARRPRASSP